MFLLNLLLTASTLIDLPSTLVLRAGNTIRVDGAIARSGHSLIFKSGGTLYSLPMDEVDITATNAFEEQRRRDALMAKGDEVVRMKANAEERERIFRKLNDTGKNSPPPPPVRPIAAPPEPSEAEREVRRAEARREERYWREESRAYHEGLRRAQEELAFLITKEQNLEDEVLMLLSLGYKPNQFSYQVLQLERTRDALERARLEITRAQRALDQFREDARREGILPGWLR